MVDSGNMPGVHSLHCLLSLQQGAPKLASTSEIATVQSLLQSQGYNTSLHTSSCSTFQYIAIFYSSDAWVPPSSVARPAGLSCSSTSTGPDGQPVEMVVPISSKYSKLSMSLMMRLMEGARNSLPAVAAAASAAVPNFQAGLSEPAAARPTASRARTTPHSTTESDFLVRSKINSSFSISLAIVNGADVVQVQLHDGIQPPSESYG